MKGLVLLVLAAVVAVPLLGVAIALFQLAWWRWMVNTGRRQAADVPWFGMLWLRGMAAAVAVLAALAIASRVGAL
jgi:hypothetical protein